MRFLLDTHVLLWWLQNNPSLTSRVKELISKPQHSIFISAASIWEIVIKKMIGKVRIAGNLLKEIDKNSFELLVITARHALEIENLPSLHQDPFDRMLIAQARCEQLELITHDRNIAKYEVPVLLV